MGDDNRYKCTIKRYSKKENGWYGEDKKII